MSTTGQTPQKSSGYNHASTGISDLADACVKAIVVRESRTRSWVFREIIEAWARRQESAKKAKV
jgi:hypothetical protein